MKNTSCSLFHFMTLWRERPDETFRWVKHVIKTISSTQFFSLDVRTSLQRNVVSHPSTCHFCPVLHIIFFLQKHLQLCISRGRHGYRHVRNHRISKNDTILDFNPWLWPCCPPKTSKKCQFEKVTEEREKTGPKKRGSPVSLIFCAPPPIFFIILDNLTTTLHAL